MNVVMFCHSLLADYSNGNAHFLRGVVSELETRGHRVRVYEEGNAWSVRSQLAEVGELDTGELRAQYPSLRVIRYDPARIDLARATDGADLVLVHEWNEPWLVEGLGSLRATSAFRLLFHDTHHRMVSDPNALARFDLSAYDGVLAFGAALRERYEAAGWGRRAFVWHEAADVRVFRSLPGPDTRRELVWIGNWGDEERTAELTEFLLEPVRDLRIPSDAYGVRYPPSVLAALREAGVEYGGWIANYRVPRAFSEHRLTLHVPRRPHARLLPGIPTIRVFEALACGIPLVSAPWDDVEGLFGPDDYVSVRNGAQMRSAIARLLADRDYAQHVAESGRSTVLERHTVAHRVDELLRICAELGVRDELRYTDSAGAMEESA